MRRILLAMLLAMVAAATPGGTALAQLKPEFELGFKTIADQIPGVVGESLGDERYNPITGDSVQQTTAGLLLWRKIDNWTGFTNGYTTWVNGPFGLQTRLNTERFQWEGNTTGLTSPLQKEDLQQAYQNAIKSAEKTDPSRIVTNLTAVTKYNDRLVWKGEPGNSPVAAATWTATIFFNDKVGQTLNARDDTFVTLAPEVQDYCSAHDFADVSLRLEQLNGLPPNGGKQWFVEFWVSPQDLFRPSPDPEIDDHEAVLDFPASPYVTISQSYKEWFNDLRSKSYLPTGYPWTRLGYTYDWGNPDSIVGLSEFVIRKGAPTEVRSVTPTLEYCRR